MKNLVEKMDEDTNKLLAEINALYDNIDAKFDQIKKQNNQNKDDILAQDNANTEKILVKLASLELKLESKTCKQTPEKFFHYCLDRCWIQIMFDFMNLKHIVYNKQYGNTCFRVLSSDVQNANNFSKSLLKWNDGEHQGKLNLGMADDDVTVLPWLPFKKNW